jgi:type IV secretory pathway VirB10-like protein
LPWEGSLFKRKFFGIIRVLRSPLMKSAILSLAALLALTPALFAEEKKAAPSTEPVPQLAPTDFLIPENLPQNPKPQGSAIPQPVAMGPASRGGATSKPAAPKPNKTQVAEDEVKLRVQYRLAKNKAVRDPAVQAAWDEAQRARTDLEKREAMTRYYTLLNARIRKTDGSLSKLTVERFTDATRRLQQTRIDPTEPLDPAERSQR